MDVIKHVTYSTCYCVLAYHKYSGTVLSAKHIRSDRNKELSLITPCAVILHMLEKTLNSLTLNTGKRELY